MKTYPTEDRAFRRQAYLARVHGIFSGVRRTGDRWQLLFDPDLTRDRAEIRLPDTEAEYAEDAEGFAWLPME